MPPKSQRQKLQVIRVPLGYQSVIHPPAFPPMPRLYMELLENKAKVKAEFRNKEYQPKDPTISAADMEKYSAQLAAAQSSQLLNASPKSEAPPPKEIEPERSSLPKTQQKPVVTRKGKGPLKIINLENLDEEQIDLKDTSTDYKYKNSDDESSRSLRASRDPPYYRSSEQYTSARENIPSSKIKDMKSSRDRERDSSGYQEESENDYSKKARNIDEDEDEHDRHHKERDHRDHRDDRERDRRDDRERDHRDDRERDHRDHRERSHRDHRERSHGEERSHRDERYRKERKEKDREYEEHYQLREKKNREENRGFDTQRNGISSIIEPAIAASALSLDDVLRKDVSISSIERNSRAESSTVAEPVDNSTTPAASSTSTYKLPPSLEDIKSGKIHQDSNGVRDVQYVTSQEEKEAGEKRDILFKFKILRRTYKEANIPEYTEYTDLKTLKKEYEMVVRQLSLDATVENYKKYLTIGFFIFEFILSNFFKVDDIKGFTQQQLLGMNQYERLLFEIGEKSYFSSAKQWSPELRLVGIIILNGAIFVGTKMLFRSTGSNLMNMLGQAGMGSSATQSHSNNGGSGQGAKPRMRGPDIDLEILGAKKRS